MRRVSGEHMKTIVSLCIDCGTSVELLQQLGGLPMFGVFAETLLEMFATAVERVEVVVRARPMPGVRTTLDERAELPPRPLAHRALSERLASGGRVLPP